MMTTGYQRSAPANPEQLRLLAKVARLYHQDGLTQPAIAAQLHLSQSRVSRLLRRASEMGMVRTQVIPPAGVHVNLEAELESRYGLAEVVVVESADSEFQLLRSLGAAAAVYLETTLSPTDRLGISSWSSTLLATVESMRLSSTPIAAEVVQILGGVGSPQSQPQATRLVGRLAEATQATPVFLPAPGLLGSASAKRTLESDPSIQDVIARWDELNVAVIGVGSLEPSQLLRDSGNAIDEFEQQRIRELGGVGDISLRFFDHAGTPIRSDLDDRVLGIDPDQLRSIDRVIAVAGGMRKLSAIRAALEGGWINVLLTDIGVATALAEQKGAGNSP